VRQYALAYNPAVAAPTPPIAVRCECGREAAVPYGERWSCTDCGRAWNTAQIPQAEYARRNRQMNRYRLEILACAALLLLVFVPLVLFVSSGYLFLGIIVGLAWMFFYMPFWRRRVRRAAANAPRWELTPE
jgi:Flp pilus assembly protein TadB